MQLLLQLYKQWQGCAPLKVERLPKAGSNREYIRFYATDGGTAIGVIGPDTNENRCFVYLSRHFTACHLPVPEIYACSPDATRYLQSDLGNRSLYQALSHGRENDANYSDEERQLIRRTICCLPHIQVEGAATLDFDRLLAPTHFDEQAAMFDFNYFKYCFLRTTDTPFDEVLLERDLHAMATDLAAAPGPRPTFLYRDFQARNVMLDATGQPHFIDFQGGQCGPLHYDVASFLWQASARYSNALREEMIAAYISELQSITAVDEEQFRADLRLFVLFRLLQVLGAYGLRGYFERKKYFIDSIPPAIQNLRRMLLDGTCLPYPHLEDTLKRMVDLPQFNEPATGHGEATRSPYDGKGPLVVRIFSFSYKKGIPNDESGNGGGYVFDCRSTHNPGRYEPYKKLTGLDAPVIKFLEDDGEILPFLDNVYQLADAHVTRYLRRGFTDLMFSFGCTGGQHRSVYSAQHLAEHLHRKFGIEVRLCHREQNIKQTLPARKNEAEG